jgi:hypothetical protein
MKQFTRRQLRDDRLLKSMARNDQLKADLSNAELSVAISTSGFDPRATASPLRIAAIHDRSPLTEDIQGWSDSYELQ